MENNNAQKGTHYDNKWERQEHGQKDDILTNNYMNNLRADAALRAEIMSDTELLNAYARNERAYEAEKRAKNAPQKEDKSPFIVKLLKKPLQWVIEQIKAVTEAMKAAMFRVALGKEGVNKVIENTRKDDEKAERKAMQEKEIMDLDKNAVREELRKRLEDIGKTEETNKGHESPENGAPTPSQNVNPSQSQNGQNTEKKDAPTQGNNKPTKSGPEPALGDGNKNRLDRMFLSAMSKPSDKEYTEFETFKTSIESHFKDKYGINIMVKAEEFDKSKHTGYLQFTIRDPNLEGPTIKYMGHGNIVIESRDKDKFEQFKDLISDYINSYDKDSQPSRTSSGIYPSTEEISELADAFLNDGNCYQKDFYGLTFATTAIPNIGQTGGRESLRLTVQTSLGQQNLDIRPEEMDRKDLKEKVEKWMYYHVKMDLDHRLKEAVKEAEQNLTTKKEPKSKADTSKQNQENDKERESSSNEQKNDDKAEEQPESANDNPKAKEPEADAQENPIKKRIFEGIDVEDKGEVFVTDLGEMLSAPQENNEPSSEQSDKIKGSNALEADKDDPEVDEDDPEVDEELGG